MQGHPLTDPSQVDELPENCIDYCFLGDENETIPYLAGVDRKSGAYLFSSLDSKTTPYTIAFIVGKIKEWAYKRFRFMSDSEPAINKLKGRTTGNPPWSGGGTERSARRRSLG